MTNFHGSTGDIILLGATTENLQSCFDALSEAGFDLGGSGSALRTPSCCVGPGRCEWACIDTLDLCNDLTHTFQNELRKREFLLLPLSSHFRWRSKQDLFHSTHPCYESQLDKDLL